MSSYSSRASWVVSISSVVFLALVGCSDEDMSPSGMGGAGGRPGSTGGGGSQGNPEGGVGGAGEGDFDPQLPPAVAKQAERWLAKKFYETWACEVEPNAKTDGAPAIHVHGAKTRVCSNIRLAASTANPELPEGVASVKEVYDASGALTGTLLSAKVHSDSDAGNGWFWYASPTSAGFGLAQCTGCHQAAGSDSDHPGAGDFVYFQVREEAELPPTDSSRMQTWLEAGHYEAWSCEAAPNMKTTGAAAIHVHGVTRVCTNARLSAGAAGAEVPSGSASVKEEYSGSTIVGRVVSLKVAATSQDGMGWYWYGGPTSAGFGLSGCTGCHQAAGSDADHPGAGDFVYFKN